MLDYSNLNVTIQDLEELHIAALEYVGEYEGNDNIVDKMLYEILKWAVPAKIFNFPKKTKLISIYPQSQEEKRLIFGITIEKTVTPPEHIKKVRIDSGKYAVARVEVESHEFQQAWKLLYRWISENGYIPQQKPPYEIQHNDSCKHPERKHIVDICVPITKVKK